MQSVSKGAVLDTMHWLKPLQSVDFAQARSSAQPVFVKHCWQAAAASGWNWYPAKAPQVRLHALSQFLARQTLNAVTSLPVPGRWSMTHCARHPGSPLQAPRHDS
jgi:hypothetical protein